MFKGWVPTKAGGDGRAIVFALQHELFAAVVEAEDFVIQVQAVHDEGQAVSKADTSLRVNLKMRVEIVVAKRPFDAPRRAIRELVRGNVGIVIREADADGDATAIVGRADVPGIGRIAQKPRMIGAPKIRAE